MAHEVAMPRIECQEKEMEPLCIPQNCWLKNNNTDCLTTDIPTEVRMQTALNIKQVMACGQLGIQTDIATFSEVSFQFSRCGWKIRCARFVKRGGLN